jgi:hypothetical protein
MLWAPVVSVQLLLCACAGETVYSVLSPQLIACMGE